MIEDATGSFVWAHDERGRKLLHHDRPVVAHVPGARDGLEGPDPAADEHAHRARRLVCRLPYADARPHVARARVPESRTARRRAMKAGAPAPRDAWWRSLRRWSRPASCLRARRCPPTRESGSTRPTAPRRSSAPSGTTSTIAAVRSTATVRWTETSASGAARVCASIPRVFPSCSPSHGRRLHDAGEHLATYRSLVGLEPTVMSAVVDGHGAHPELLTFVRKARGLEAHKGGSLITPGDDQDVCITSWLAGQTDLNACSSARPLPDVSAGRLVRMIRSAPKPALAVVVALAALASTSTANALDPSTEAAAKAALKRASEKVPSDGLCIGGGSSQEGRASVRWRAVLGGHQGGPSARPGRHAASRRVTGPPRRSRSPTPSQSSRA